MSNSRVCVKNIPKHISEDRLREVFSKSGDVTDVRILRTAEGRSRKFGFIGFRTAAQANAAIHFFNNTYVDTSKIHVELAKAVGDETLPRPWSKYSKRATGDAEDAAERSAANGNAGAVGTGADAAPSAPKSDVAGVVEQWRNKESDPKLREFLEGKTEKKVVRNRRRGGEGVAVETLHTRFEDDDGGSSDDEEYEDIGGERAVRSERGEPSESEDSADDGGDAGGEGDLAWLRQHAGRVRDDDPQGSSGGEGEHSGADDDDEDDSGSSASDGSDDEDASASDRASGPEEPPSEGKQAAARQHLPRANVHETKRLFVRNLPFTATEDDLVKHFSAFGEIGEVHVPVQSSNGQNKGFAFVTFLEGGAAADAIDATDNTIFMGRLLHVLPAHQNKPVQETAQKAKTYRERQEAAKKLSAGKESRKQRSIFIPSDAVVEALAAKYDVRKGQILDRESDNLAVRVALGEASVIAETKQAFANAGIDVERLENHDEKATLSKTTIIAKNVPFGTQERELRSMFSKFGPLNAFVCPPSRALVLVDFIESRDAKRALAGLAYRKVGSLPLYLRWAPEGTCPAQEKQTVTPQPSSVQPPSISNTPTTDTEEHRKTEHESQNQDDDDEGSGKTLFVKNVSFNSTEKSLRKLFARVGDVRSVRIPQKKDVKTGKALSMGYAFVEFARHSDAKKAVKTLQNALLDEHELQLKFSEKASGSFEQSDSKAGVSSAGKRARSSKLLVKNLAFEATKREVQELFSAFAHVKSVRIPKKFDGTHRGFAFVELSSKGEAEAARNALADAHLYGRHLVIEFAKEDPSVGDLQQRAAKVARRS